MVAGKRAAGDSHRLVSRLCGARQGLTRAWRRYRSKGRWEIHAFALRGLFQTLRNSRGSDVVWRRPTHPRRRRSDSHRPSLRYQGREDAAPAKRASSARERERGLVVGRRYILHSARTRILALITKNNKNKFASSKVSQTPCKICPILLFFFSLDGYTVVQMRARKCSATGASHGFW